jgi:hypothetical protein
MAISTVTDWRNFGDDFDPNTLKMPNNPRHRRIIEAIRVAADTQVDSSHHARSQAPVARS